MIARAMVLVLLGLALAPDAVRAQAGGRERCIFANTPQSRLTRVQTPSGESNVFIGAGVRVNCPSKEITLRADSLESYGDEGRLFLVGNVDYNEPRLALTSDFLTYYQRDERIVANGNVNARLPSGSTLRGPVAEYQRAVPQIRAIPRLIASGRPTITIVQRDSAGNAGPPMTVLANNVTMVGDSLVYAGGAVQVTREEVIARGDSMALDSNREYVVMLRQPSIEGRRDRPFTLSGDRIEMMSRARELERVLATGRGRAVSEDLTLTSDTIDLRVQEDLLQRAIAWGPARATAFSPTQRILADSIDVSMPAQRVREMRAIGGAAAEGKPDTLRFRADTMDWLRGDTIVARFDTAATGDSASGTRIRELIARDSARAYYHLPPADSAVRRPAINYVIGREIVIAFAEGRVARVTVIEQAAGVYLEPRPEAAPAGRSDSAAVAPRAAPAPNPPGRPPR